MQHSSQGERLTLGLQAVTRERVPGSPGTSTHRAPAHGTPSWIYQQMRHRHHSCYLQLRSAPGHQMGAHTGSASHLCSVASPAEPTLIADKKAAGTNPLCEEAPFDSSSFPIREAKLLLQDPNLSSESVSNPFPHLLSTT